MVAGHSAETLAGTAGVAENSVLDLAYTLLAYKVVSAFGDLGIAVWVSTARGAAASSGWSLALSPPRSHPCFALAVSDGLRVG